MQNTPDIEVLNSIYKNAVTGSQAIEDLLPMTEDKRFISDLETQNSEYMTIGADAASQLVNLGAEVEPIGTMKKAGMKMGVVMNTMVNDDTCHLAELMIKGSNMGIIDMTKTINSFSNASPEALGLAQKLIDMEHNNIVKLKEYLEVKCS